MNRVQMLFEMVEGMNEEAFFEELNDAVREVVRRNEKKFNACIDVSAYIIDDEGMAVH